MRQIERMPKPVIARVNGFALGGGLELAMACHLRIAADTAKVGQPEINLGLIPGFGGSQRLLRLCGRAATLELCLLGAPIDAARALELGIVNEVCRPTRWTTACRTSPASWHARRRWPCAACSMRCTWAANAAWKPGWNTKAQFGLLFATEDMREGTSAFLQRRPPAFQNR
jgi:enoyl-CoA hydratase